MERKTTPATDLFPTAPASPVLALMLAFNRLKTLYRQGWLRAGVPRDQCESVAEHSLGVAVLSWAVAETYFPDLDRTKLLYLSLFHDFGEIYAGDIVPGRMSLAEKHQLELDAVHRVFDGVPGADLAIAAWQEFEDLSTPEARLVKEIDRLEMGVQAAVYERAFSLDLTDFFDSTVKAVQSPALQPLLDALRDLRPSAKNPD